MKVSLFTHFNISKPLYGIGFCGMSKKDREEQYRQYSASARDIMLPLSQRDEYISHKSLAKQIGIDPSTLKNVQKTWDEALLALADKVILTKEKKRESDKQTVYRVLKEALEGGVRIREDIIASRAKCSLEHLREIISSDSTLTQMAMVKIP